MMHGDFAVGMRTQLPETEMQELSDGATERHFLLVVHEGSFGDVEQSNHG